MSTFARIIDDIAVDVCRVSPDQAFCEALALQFVAVPDEVVPGSRRSLDEFGDVIWTAPVVVAPPPHSHITVASSPGWRFSTALPMPRPSPSIWRALARRRRPLRCGVRRPKSIPPKKSSSTTLRPARACRRWKPPGYLLRAARRRFSIRRYRRTRCRRVIGRRMGCRRCRSHERPACPL